MEKEEIVDSALPPASRFGPSSPKARLQVVVATMYSNSGGKSSHKGGNKGGNSRSKPDGKTRLLCMHCGKSGHVESTCWEKHPDLKPKKQQASGDSHAHIAFQSIVNPRVVRKVTIIGNGVHNSKGHPDHWILDSGASEHFSPYRHLYGRYLQFKEPVNVQTAKGHLDGIGIGSINVTVTDGRNFRTGGAKECSSCSRDGLESPLQQRPRRQRLRSQHASDERNEYPQGRHYRCNDCPLRQAQAPPKNKQQNCRQRKSHRPQDSWAETHLTKGASRAPIRNLAPSSRPSWTLER
jgi:hypothetical protein